MKKVRQFREKVRSALEEKDREAYVREADPLLYSEVGIETALFLLEHTKYIRNRGGDLSQLMKLLGSVLHAPLLLLQKKGGGASVQYTDVQISSALEETLCKEGGFYARLASVRFTREMHAPAGELQFVEAQSHSRIAALAAVPLRIGEHDQGSLVVLSATPMNFTPGYFMLLALAGEIVSMWGPPSPAGAGFGG